MQAMLTTANELSCISFIDNNNFSMDRRENRLRPKKQNGNISIFSNTSDCLSMNHCDDIQLASSTYANEPVVIDFNEFLLVTPSCRIR